MAEMTLPRLVASGYGIGWFPWAPGTLASLVAAIAGAGLLQLSPWLLAAAALVATVSGLWAVAAAGAGNEDPGWVVIDEVAGQWLALTTLPQATVPGLVAGFLLFRLLDIVKPGPVGWADRRRGPLAVMGDDLIAGAMVAVLLFLLTALRPRWLD